MQQLVELHGGDGRARCSDGPGKGSEFVSAFRVARAAGPEGRDAPGASRDGAALRVLVVDDNVDAAEMLGMVLRAQWPCRARWRTTASRRCSRARDLRPDVVVLDIGLPGASGYEVARAIRAEPALAGVRLVAVTGYGRDEDRARCIDAGFDLHLVKPLEPAQLLQGISRQVN